MAAHEALGRQQFSGHIHPKYLLPTETGWQRELRWPSGQQYQADLESHISEHGFPEPVEVRYSDRGQYGSGRQQKPKLYIDQGHHRWNAAKKLGLKVPVTVTSSIGRPPELE